MERDAFWFKTSVASGRLQKSISSIRCPSLSAGTEATLTISFHSPLVCLENLNSNPLSSQCSQWQYREQNETPTFCSDFLPGLGYPPSISSVSTNRFSQQRCGFISGNWNQAWKNKQREMLGVCMCVPRHTISEYRVTWNVQLVFFQNLHDCFCSYFCFCPGYS